MWMSSLGGSVSTGKVFSQSSPSAGRFDMAVGNASRIPMGSSDEDVLQAKAKQHTQLKGPFIEEGNGPI